MVPLRGSLERFERGIPLSIGLCLASVLGRHARAVELCRYQAGDREQLGLLVELERHAASKVYRQIRNPAHGLVDPDQLLLDRAVLALDHQATRNAQVAVEPCVPHSASVGLNTNLHETLAAAPRDGLDAKAGRIGVRANHAHGVSRFPRIADCECDDSARVAGQVVLAAGVES